MGLERVREVARRLGLGRPASHVITVGGTNGKGSTVAFIEAIARAGGLARRRVHFAAPAALQRAHPHRWRGGRRRHAGRAFERIEAARGRDPADLFRIRHAGRVAGVRAVASWTWPSSKSAWAAGSMPSTSSIADVAVITTVDLDHQEYLGDDREAIGADKAGILRARQALRAGRERSAVLGAAPRLRDRRVRDSRARRLPGRRPRAGPGPGGSPASKSTCRSQAWARRRRSTTRRPQSPRCARCRCRSRTRRWSAGFARRGSPAGCRSWPSRRKSWSMWRTTCRLPASWPAGCRENPRPTRAVFSALQRQGYRGHRRRARRLHRQVVSGRHRGRRAARPDRPGAC